MDAFDDSTDRRTIDFVLFAIAFVAFMTALCAVVVSAAGIAIAGGVIFVMTILFFRFRAWVAE